METTHDGEFVGETVEVDGIALDLEKVKDSTRRCVIAIMCIRAFERQTPHMDEETALFIVELESILRGDADG